MAKKKDLTGQKFGILTVIEPAAPIPYKHKSGRIDKLTTSKCLCECGEEKIIRNASLKSGHTKSCGCLVEKEDIIGKKFGRLVVIEETDVFNKEDLKVLGSECICECGNIVGVRNYHLLSGRVKSCGCLRKKSLKSKNIVPITRYRTGCSPKIISSYAPWISFYKKELSFYDFYNLSQMNCFYCDLHPSLSNKVINNNIRNYEKYSEEDYIFTYNGLDRIDNNLHHKLENVVPCCIICNMAKSDNILEFFINYINRLINNDIILSFDEYRDLAKNIDIDFFNDKKNNYSFIGSIKDTFSGKRYSTDIKGKYNDEDLTIEQFYQLSQLPCYYCGLKYCNKYNAAYSKSKNNSSKYAVETGTFIYNGLDRIDNTRGHFYDNIIPCCKYCNFAKSDMSIEKFFEWKNRLKNNFHNWKNFVAEDIKSIPYYIFSKTG